MIITATHINYYHLCRRKLWLFSNQIQMEHTSSIVAEGNLIGATTYDRRHPLYEQVELDGIKIDYYDRKTQTIHETKKSDKVEHAHIAQVKYYLYRMEQQGIPVKRGVIEYPTLRKTEEVMLTDLDRSEIPKWEKDIDAIISSPVCPALVKKGICKSCSYYEFCYTEE